MKNIEPWQLRGDEHGKVVGYVRQQHWMVQKLLQHYACVGVWIFVSGL